MRGRGLTPALPMRGRAQGVWRSSRYAANLASWRKYFGASQLKVLAAFHGVSDGTGAAAKAGSSDADAAAAAAASEAGSSDAAAAAEAGAEAGDAKSG